MPLRSGRIFLTEQHIYVYRSLVLERFLMDIPREMGARYHSILFNRKTARLFNDEMLHTIEMFFAKDLEPVRYCASALYSPQYAGLSSG